MKNLTLEQMPSAICELYGKLESIEQLLKADNRNPKDESGDLLTIQQAGEFLHLSVPTLYGHVSKSTIPVSKQGKRLYFSKKELTEWIKSGRKQTVSEIKKAVEEGTNGKKKHG